MWLALAFACVAAWAVAKHARGERGGYALALAIGVTPLFGLLIPISEPIPSGAPETSRGLYIGSGACKGCHPAEHASWDQSFHQSMTQIARGDAIALPIGRHELDVPGGRVEIERTKDKLVMRMPDPEALARGEEQTIEAEAVLTTGSHHYQAYWVKGRRAGELRAAPFVWHLELERLIPRHDVFLQPPDRPDHLVRWNSNCLVCHATAAEPRHDPARDVFETRTVELGVACEACHGPGGHHADRFRDPFARYAARSDEEAKTDIVNPAELTKQRSTELCGQCHSYAMPRDEDAWWSSGFVGTFAPGEPLGESRTVIQKSTLETPGGVSLEAASESLFWGDGTIRVGGRELNALTLSSCFLRGEGERKIGCVDCHRLHGGDPNDQLKDEAKTGAVCSSCHPGEASETHTRHRPGSVGSECYGCHMPRISYALYRSQRSHRIDSPNVDVAQATGRPPACNLCHVDRTLAWTLRELERGWGHKTEIVLSPEPLAFVVEMALAGDAASRVIAANELVSPEALAAAGSDFQAPILAALLEDPYAAVRQVAGRGLLATGGLRAGEYDFLAEPRARAAARDAVLRRWGSVRHQSNADVLHPNGELDYARLQAALARRDNRPISIAE